ncbi:MAG: mechanosensitive ion channel [Candidatus Nanohaloarchaea archaeon]|nr:mechanosensitive ion channel [Candidatus Nanohaloarchaea archaeon]
MAMIGQFLDQGWRVMTTFLEIEGFPRAEIVSILVIFVVGIIGGHLLSEVIRRILKMTALDDLAVKSGVQSLLRKLDYAGTLSDLIATTIRYLIYLLVVFAIFNLLGVEFLLTYVQMVMSYAPRALIALLVVIFGFVVSDHLQNITVKFFRAGPMSRMVDEAEAEYPAYRIVGQFVKLIGVVASLLAAFAILGLNQLAITMMISIFSLGLVAVFVLASWSVMKNVAVSFYFQLSKTFKAGETIEVDGHRGEIKHITPLYTKIGDGDSSYLIPNTHFLNHIVEHEK